MGRLSVMPKSALPVLCFVRVSCPNRDTPAAANAPVCEESPHRDMKA